MAKVLRFCHENQQAIAQAKAETIPSCNLNSFITLPSPLP